MSRTVHREYTTDTSHFNPIQFQPRSLLSICFNMMFTWWREYFVSFAKANKVHHLGWVFVGLRIEYFEKFEFHDADGFEVTLTGAKLRKNGSLIEFFYEFYHEQKCFAKVRTVLYALKLSGDESLSASPGHVDGLLLSKLHPDEIDPTTPEREVSPILKVVEASGTLLAQGEHSFSLHRHLCEVADQWCFVELAGFCGASRESLVFKYSDKVRELSKGLASPMKKSVGELNRAYFLFDEGVVKTKAYKVGDEVYFIHDLHAKNDPRRQRPYATVIEIF